MIAVVAATLLFGGAFSMASRAETPKLIPRDILFGNPTKTSPRISPDGQKMSYIAPSKDNVLNVWVKTIGKDDDLMVTNDTHRGIRIHFWTQDSKRVLFLQDLNGDENWHLYSADLATKIVRDLTPFQGVRAENVMTSRKKPAEILVAMNLRSKQLMDMYRIDLNTGAVVMDTENPGDVVGWLTDPDFQIRAAQAMNPADASMVLRVRDSKDAQWKDIASWPFGEEGGPIDFTKDGKALFASTTLGSETGRLVKLDASSGKEVETIAQNPKCDFSGLLYDDINHVIQAVSFIYLKQEWKILDPSISGDFDAISKLHKGEFSIIARDDADQTWIVAFDVDDGPVAFYAYHRDNKKGDFLFFNRPDLEQYKMAKMEPVVIKSRDGMDLVSYLTLPPGVEAKNLPLVLNVHGGPWARDTWGYNPEAQWFANRGYATLQVNFRSSTGLGKSFVNAGDKEWGGKMQDDLTDAVKWAIQKGIADPKKVCIYGGSYGGYATLAGLVFTPDLYACGVDIVGPSNLKTLLQSFPPYWMPMKKLFLKHIGDVESDEAVNKKCSPLFHAEKIRVPLLIGQGQNDPRVNIKEADQIVEAMRAKKLPVSYVVYTDEGHGFARPENRMDFYGRTEEFLGKELGGRVEPWKEVKGSSASVR